MSEEKIKINLQHKHPSGDWVYLALRFLFIGLRGTLSWVARQLAHQVNHSHLSSAKIGISGAIPPLPIFPGTTLLF